MCLVWVPAGTAQGPALTQEIPAAVELDLKRPQPFLVGLECVWMVAVGLFTASKHVLLGNQALDPGRDALVAHMLILACAETPVGRLIVVELERA
jgi:hypothetical protein